MKPIQETKNRNFHLWIFYLVIFLICVAGIAVAVYLEYYKDERIDLIFGVSDEESEEKDKYNDLKSEFPSIFENRVEIIQDSSIKFDKIREEEDIVFSAFSYERNDEKCTLNAKIPFINIKKDIPIQIDKKIKNLFQAKAEKLKNFGAEETTIFSVSYMAYLQNDIISVIIRVELKEENKNQKIIIKTFNYDIKNDKEVTLKELADIKGISKEKIEEKVRKEIKEIQKENETLEQALEGIGELYKRDYTSDKYKFENTTEYFLGKDGMIYIVYPYGNNDYTSEMDIVIII